MTPANSKPIRIAIVVDREDACCLPVNLPFSVVGYPLLQIEFFKTGVLAEVRPPIDFLPESQHEWVILGLADKHTASPPRPISDLRVQDFDLVLDRQNWMSTVPEPSLDGLTNLITGPGTPLLEKMLCQSQDLRYKHEINAGILINATDAIVTIDEHHTIVGFNYGAEKMFGYPRQEALGQDLSIIIPPPYKEKHQEYVRRYTSTRRPHVVGKHLQLRAQRRDGTEFPLSISFSVADIHGKLFFTGIIRDISDYKQMEERLLQSERLATVGNTVAHIAHEIKNPLMIIGGFARQLLKVTCLDEKSRHKLEIMVQEVSRLETLVAEMRDFVRPAETRKTLGNVEPLIEATLEFFQDLFTEHHIQVQRVSPGTLPAVNFDAKQIRQVLINLFKNAIEAMSEGGTLTLTTQIKDRNLQIGIADTGSGMLPETAAKIFQPYYTTKEKGTGLGLAICQFIVEQQHGGCIDVASIPGQGSTFTIQLPLQEMESS
jgi:two-component system sensor kinase FixL